MKKFQKELWHGSYYEIAMEFFPRIEVSRVITALKSLLENSKIKCQWADQNFTEIKQIPDSLDEYTFTSFFGTINLKDGKELGCHIVILREQERSNWLDICIPTGMLEATYELSYPLEHKNNCFLYDIDDLFIELAMTIYNAAKFDFAIIGEEVSGSKYITDLTEEDIKNGGIILPRRYMKKEYLDLNKRQIEDLYYFQAYSKKRITSSNNVFTLRGFQPLGPPDGIRGSGFRRTYL